MSIKFIRLLLQIYHKRFGFAQQIQEKWNSQLQAPIFTSWTKLDLCTKYNTTINSKQLRFSWETGSLWTYQEIPHRLRNHKLGLPTKRNSTINATEQKVSWKAVVFIMPYFGLFLISLKKGAGCLYIQFLVLCLFDW